MDKMEPVQKIELTLEEVQLIVNILSEFPAKHTYNVIKLLDTKVAECNKN